MASLGRLTVSLASATQEATAALANFNIDFSMVKFEAEDGSFHVTARKLGILFQEDLPNIPHLTEAYGFRCSEIAEKSRLYSADQAEHGALNDLIGVDGTSVWAAATSGRGALEAHLLACLLARAWPGSEAVSIWIELVAIRKALLKERLRENIYSIATLTAANVELSCSKLSEWDTSARAVSTTLIYDTRSLQFPQLTIRTGSGFAPRIK
jgi:hypothetical protein